MRNQKKISLAESENFKVVYEYECVDLVFKKHNLFTTRDSVYLGDFYGDPECGMISKDEKYLVVGGKGSFSNLAVLI